ncbi:MAG: RcnB family protein [Sphingomicrobium sp.]
MRKFLILFLLASAATPSLARPDTDDDTRPSRASRGEARSAARAERSESRPARAERSEASGLARAQSNDNAPIHVERVRSVDRPQWSGGERPQRTQELREQRRTADDSGPAIRPPEAANSGNAGVTNWRRHERVPEPATATTSETEPRGWTQQPRDGDIADRRFRRVLDRRFGDRDGRVRGEQPSDGVWNEHVRDRLAVSTVPRPGTQPPLRVRSDGQRWDSRWSRDWRDDNRYDWRRHRDRHRSIFHIGFYYDPFGWNYQRYQPGWRMWPSYYSRSHWLNDPWSYRLPPAYPGTLWIRYHGDAILVDTWSGEVIDVIHDFFW